MATRNLDSSSEGSIHSDSLAKSFLVNQAADRFSSRNQHRLITTAVALIIALFGYEQGVFGGILVGSEFQQYFNHPSPLMTGLVTAIYDFGCFLGALLTLAVGDKLGRRHMLIIFTCIMTTGIMIQTAATSMTTLIAGRIIAGIGNGGNTTLAPIWHVETASPEKRSKALVIDMTVNVLGFVLSNISTLAFSSLTNNGQWRWPLGIQLLFPLAILLLIPMLPESPRWLLAHHRELEAMVALKRLSEGQIENEFKDLRKTIRAEMDAEASWTELLKGGTDTRRVLLGMMLQVFQQLSGINLYCYYLPYVLTLSVGLPELAARWLATGIAVLYMLATYASSFLIDRLGRRDLLMWLSGLLSIACVSVAISSKLESDGGAFIPGIAAAIGMTVYLVGFGLGWVAIPWLYASEINSLSMRTKGAGLATACNWWFNLLVVVTTPIGIDSLHWMLYLVYAAMNAAFIPVIYFLVVNTARQPLEEIDRWFAANPGWLIHNAKPIGAREAVDPGPEEERQGLVETDGEANEPIDQTWDRDTERHTLLST